MTRKSIMTALSCFALVIGAESLGVPAYGQQVPRNVAQASDVSTAPTQVQPVFGAIAGVVRTSSKLPIVGAMVTVAKADGKGIWTTISGSEGIFSIPNVAPGEYLVTSQADGYPDTTVSKLQITAGRATRTDVIMAANVTPQPAVITANSSTTPPAAPRGSCE